MRMISTDQISAVYPKVARAIADAAAREVEECKPTSRIIGDLGAESIDLLDIVVRFECAFKIKIPRNQIIKDARGDLSEAEFERKGVVTEASRKRLEEYLSEVPPSIFPRSCGSTKYRTCSRSRLSTSSSCARSTRRQSPPDHPGLASPVTSLL
jgi:acyl carrier protein